MEGVIRGGYAFIAAAYAVTLIVLGGYWISLLARYRSVRRRGDQGS